MVLESDMNRSPSKLLSDLHRGNTQRKETIERSFADAKQHHGHRYARFRGLLKVQIQCLLAATAQNIKKIALLVATFCYFYCWIKRACDTAEAKMAPRKTITWA
nr:transposase [Photorhabdus temperata]